MSRRFPESGKSPPAAPDTNHEVADFGFAKQAPGHRISQATWNDSLCRVYYHTPATFEPWRSGCGTSKALRCTLVATTNNVLHLEKYRWLATLRRLPHASQWCRHLSKIPYRVLALSFRVLEYPEFSDPTAQVRRR